MRTLGLYVHIPFCLRKCGYCNFVSFPDRLADADRYTAALLDEMRLYAGVLENRLIDTVFIGGGTPSLLTPAQTERLMDGIHALRLGAGAEITVEANPETLDAEKLSAYKALGVNRLSIGLQTHDDALLRRIGRGHTWRGFTAAFEAAAQYFQNISADVIFGLPGQTADSFAETLRRLTGLNPPHISAYALKLEEGTPLAATFAGADEDADRAMYHLAARMLEEAGYTHYETSNFARPGCECRHNLKYWTGGDYLGLGVAAYSYLADGGPVRFGNVADMDAYLAHIEKGQRPVAETDRLSAADELTEYIMLRLRLKSGIAFADYQSRFGTRFGDDFAPALEKTLRAGLITADRAGIYPTLKGFDLQNALIGEYIKKL